MDDFFKKTKCDRCGGNLSIRTQSWFNNHDVICGNCGDEEVKIKTKLRETHGQNFEACGIHINQLRVMAEVQNG